jgi:hypothetical protein
VATAVADAPGPHSPGVDLGQALGECKRVAVVLDLLPGIDLLSRKAGAGTETAVIERQARYALRDDPRRVVGHDDLLDVAPAAGHHDERERTLLVGCVEGRG